MGRSHALRLAQEGATVIALDVDSARTELAETCDHVRSLGGRCIVGIADVCSREQLDDAVAAGLAQCGRLDAVVVNAGIYPAATNSWELDDEQWERVIDVNLSGAWHTVCATVPHLTRGAAVVFVGSTNAVKGAAGVTHYAAAKHGLAGLAQTLANELGPEGIRVNTVHPGAVATSMIRNDRVFAKVRPDLENPTEADAIQALAARSLLEVPWVEPRDVSNAVLFLVSDEARYVTGTSIVVDAGILAKVA